MTWKSFLISVALVSATILGGGTTHAATAPSAAHATLLATGLDEAIGSTIGPDGALYVAQGTLGQISRIDPTTGKVTTFASGLPKQLSAVGLGGAMDVAFLDNTAYVLVTLVSPDVGGTNVDGIYRVDGPNQVTPIADIGTFNINHPPTIPFDYFVQSGVQFALQPYQGGFLVTDGHLNRVLQVSTDGTIRVLLALGDVVPTGMTLSGGAIYMTEAGPVPHLAKDGKVVAFGRKLPTPMQVASGASLLVDVKYGPGHTLYAVSQGDYSGNPPGSPALPNTGSLVRANQDGTVTAIATGLDRPTSLEFIGHTGYVTTLTGQVWAIDV